MRPIKSALHTRIREFFLRNPEEELTFADAKLKFSCKDANLSMAVKKLRADGTLEPSTIYLLRAKAPPCANSQKENCFSKTDWLSLQHYFMNVPK